MDVESNSKPGDSSKVKVLVINIKTEEITEYSSMTEAGEVLGVNKTTIGKAVKNKSLIQGNYICRLINGNLNISEEISEIKFKLEKGAAV